MSVSNKKKTECFGCNACAEICPKHCICMKEDSKGFFYPHVDASACVECGACEKICPFNDFNRSLCQLQKAYAAWNKNEEEHFASSSGGAAYVFSSYILEKNGIVYGCAANGTDVRHIRINSLCELKKLQGSKYVQSNVQGIFKQVKNDLQQQRPVLFIGTPCQVAGLKNYIRTVPPHLYLVDLICHGVPSLKMLSDHVAQISKGREIMNISFRLGTKFMMAVDGKGFSYERIPYWKDAYMRSFMDGFTYRASCYHCPYATSSRVGDITIGDFWGLNDAIKRPSEKHSGISVLLPCTEKGLQFIHDVKTRFVLYERTVEEAVVGNTQLRHPVHRTLRNRVFNLLWPLLPFDTAVSLCVLPQRVNSFIRLLLHGVRK